MMRRHLGRMAGDPTPHTLLEDLVTAVSVVAVTSLPTALLGYALFR